MTHWIRHDRTAGLVVHPGMHPTAYKDGKIGKALKAWNDGMPYLSGHPPRVGNALKPETWAPCGVERPADYRPDWRWRVNVDPASPHYGCLQLRHSRLDWSCIHGDDDLKDVIVPGAETDNRRVKGQLQGVKNFTPLLLNADSNGCAPGSAS